MENVIIIGSGPAGHTAAIYTARAGLKPLVLEGLQPGGQLTITTEVENYPGFPDGVTGPELVEKMKQQALRMGARYEFADVVSCELAGKTKKVTLSDGAVRDAKVIIIATGASAIYLGIDSEKKLMGRGVSACATCDGSFYRGLNVAVVGGGDTACEEALYLSGLAAKVYLIHRRNEFRASKIMSERVRQKANIELVLESVVEEVLDVAKNTVTGVKVKNVKSGVVRTIAVDGYFAAIGHKPNTDPFKGQIELDDKGYIIARETKTNIAGVFAAGDVQDKVFRQAITAAGSGCSAAIEAERYLQNEV